MVVVFELVAVDWLSLNYLLSTDAAELAVVN